MVTKNICYTCRRSCNTMDKSRGTACKDYEKKTKKIAPTDTLASSGAIKGRNR